jgi:hypothetical protein
VGIMHTLQLTAPTCSLTLRHYGNTACAAIVPSMRQTCTSVSLASVAVGMVFLRTPPNKPSRQCAPTTEPHQHSLHPLPQASGMHVAKWVGRAPTTQITPGFQAAPRVQARLP